MAKKKSAARIAATVSAAAEQLGVGERTLAAWLARGCPGEKNAYDLDDIEAWRAANVKPRKTVDGSDRAKWEARKARADALIRELRMLEARGQLVRVDSAAQIVRQHISEVNTHLDQLPDFAVAGSRLPAEQKKKLHARIKGKVRDLRATFERALRAMAKAARSEGKQDASEADDDVDE